jgi:hypothetical protein
MSSATDAVFEREMTVLTNSARSSAEIMSSKETVSIELVKSVAT